MDLSSTFNPSIAFPEVQGNLAKIAWAHAVNDKKTLKRTLESGVMMIEADVIMGHLLNDGSATIPVMGRPAKPISDLSLDDFLQEIDLYNKNELNKLKGLKLDFKSTAAVEAACKSLSKIYQKANYPIWISADVFKGAINANDPVVDYKALFNLASALPNVILSLGWTTKYTSDDTSSYSKDQLEVALNLLQENNIKNTITFALHAGLACEDIELVEGLLTRDDYTLTLWADDFPGAGRFNIEKTLKLLNKIGYHRIYIDMPAKRY